ncbi:MAG TPA: hypothetical protein ENK31_07945, partial [Nannocystis exedens]|nr:hypothetical protein [Nannocystis exedens]
EQRPDGWIVRYRGPAAIAEERFDFVIISSGQYSGTSRRPEFAGMDDFRGEIITADDVHDLDATFSEKRVVVVGFGKTAVDLATLAMPRAKETHHVFRTPRWLVPERIAGIHYTYPFFSRYGTAMIPSWTHPSRAERILHHRLPLAVRGFWRSISALLRAQLQLKGLFKGAQARARLRTVLPPHNLLKDMRSATAQEPRGYYRAVAEGMIQPAHAKIQGFSADSVRLDDGREIAADLVVLSLGSLSPTFPFLAGNYRQLLESEPDGPQLYRHLLHPRIRHLAFAGFNHGFMHIAAVEVGMLWLSAYLRGDLKLPNMQMMEAEIDRIRTWKRAHISFEPARSCAINTRFMQYLDTLLLDLGLSPYRKLPSLPAEFFRRYRARDYAGLVEEYERQRGAT